MTATSNGDVTHLLEQGIEQPHSKLRCLVSLNDGVGKGKVRVKHFEFCALMAAFVGLVTLWSTLVTDPVINVA
jgi:hypothetical protein